MPPATKCIPRADTSRVVVLSRTRSNRNALWVLSERRMNSVGAVYTEPAISRASGGVQGGTSRFLMYRPSLFRPDAVAAFAAVSTVRCARTRAIHRMGSDQRRPCSVHCQIILIVVRSVRAITWQFDEKIRPRLRSRALAPSRGVIDEPSRVGPLSRGGACVQSL